MLLNLNKTSFQMITGPSLVSDGNHVVTRQNHLVMGFVFVWFMLVLHWLWKHTASSLRLGAGHRTRSISQTRAKEHCQWRSRQEKKNQRISQHQHRNGFARSQYQGGLLIENILLQDKVSLSWSFGVDMVSDVSQCMLSVDLVDVLLRRRRLQ